MDVKAALQLEQRLDINRQLMRAGMPLTREDARQTAELWHQVDSRPHNRRGGDRRSYRAQR